MPKRLELITGSTTSRRKGGPRPKVGLLFTCVGRRVELVNAFRRAATQLNINLTIHGADRSWLAPAMSHVDRAHIVPSIADPAHVDALLEMARLNRIDLVIPLIDNELLPLSQAASTFADAGVNVVISTENVIRTCRDKLKTYETLKSAGIDTPRTWSIDVILQKRGHRFPYFMKPREGSAGMGAFRVDDRETLEILAARVPNPIIQEFVEGVEHTLDVYTGFDGRPRCVVPRKRLEVRSGEVSKAVTVKNRRVIAIGRRVARTLGGCRGVVTVQCIVTPEKRIRVIEINPRFGGGAPLGIRAGADYPLWLLSEHLGRPVHIDPLGFESNLAMLRYDESVFISMDTVRSRQ
jgi:carbamoyl-phosphate synthase large subunit